MKKDKPEPDPKVRLQFTELELMSILWTFDEAEEAGGKISGTDREFRFHLVKKVSRRMILAVKRLREKERSRDKQDVDKST